MVMTRPFGRSGVPSPADVGAGRGHRSRPRSDRTRRGRPPGDQRQSRAGGDLRARRRGHVPVADPALFLARPVRARARALPGGRPGLGRHRGGADRRRSVVPVGLSRERLRGRRRRGVGASHRGVREGPVLDPTGGAAAAAGARSARRGDLRGPGRASASPSSRTRCTTRWGTSAAAPRTSRCWSSSVGCWGPSPTRSTRRCSGSVSGSPSRPGRRSSGSSRRCSASWPPWRCMRCGTPA